MQLSIYRYLPIIPKSGIRMHHHLGKRKVKKRRESKCSFISFRLAVALALGVFRIPTTSAFSLPHYFISPFLSSSFFLLLLFCIGCRVISKKADSTFLSTHSPLALSYPFHIHLSHSMPQPETHGVVVRKLHKLSSRAPSLEDELVEKNCQWASSYSRLVAFYDIARKQWRYFYIPPQVTYSIYSFLKTINNKKVCYWKGAKAFTKCELYLKI